MLAFVAVRTDLCQCASKDIMAEMCQRNRMFWDQRFILNYARMQAPNAMHAEVC